MSAPNGNPIRVCIVGAGLAGAATAFHLSENEGYQITLMDKERLPGVHSSGRNAAMIRQVVQPAAIAQVAQDSRRFLEATAGPSADFRLDSHGSLLLGSNACLEEIRTGLQEQDALSDDVRMLGRRDLHLEFEPLVKSEYDSAIFTPSDGVVDVAGLLEYYIREARSRGVTLALSTTVIDIVRDGNRIDGVQTNAGYEPFDIVVNAAGPWTARLGAMIGSTTIPWRPFRRHLFFTGPLDWVDPSLPFIWDIENHWYLRPESGGLLLCACDETLVEPGIPDIDPSVTQLLTDKLSAHIPELDDLPIAKVWSGIRTFAPDRNFVIGWDLDVEGFFWVSGLGGHGVTCSWGVGACAARVLTGKDDFGDRNFSPSRFWASAD
ncbi:MAG: glycine/D-amino acid oxidase-like deaminating enzyme [Planctomycetota bacterium]|jgi:glycine/D-amino acid oxidase-like deaminating enzyme